MEMETVEIGRKLFYFTIWHIIFAEPGRKIVIGDNTLYCCRLYFTWPPEIGSEVAINHHCILDGGRVGI